MAKTTKNDVTIMIVIIGVIAIFLIGNSGLINGGGSTQKQELDESGLTNWQIEYKTSATTNLGSYDRMVKNTDYYLLDDPLIISVAADIAENSPTTMDAIKNTLEYVFLNVNYLFDEPDEACFQGTAPGILASGEGQCDTQSIVVIALLRRMGIAAVPVGGCVVPDPSCKLQSLLLNANIKLPGSPKYQEIVDVDIEATSFGRGFSRTGGLHAWVTAWVPDVGWVELEPTAGRLADLKCYDYHVELYPTNNNREDICVSKSYQYALGCKDSNFDLLNQNGLGVAGEVTPS